MIDRPAGRAITRSPSEVAAAVRAVQSGGDLTTTAATVDMPPADLEDAVQLYHAGGLVALEQAAEQDWCDVRIQFPDWDNAEATVAAQLGPRLDELQTEQAIAGWWFLRKRPGWRVRLHHADIPTVSHTLDRLTTAGTIAGWWSTVYEPETTAFGGLAGIATVHDLFCADSHGVLDYARLTNPGVGRRELSLLLLRGLFQAAGLDWFEHGDVFTRVGHLRPAPPGIDTAKVTADVRHLFTLHAAGSRLFAPGGPAAFARPWHTAFMAAGSQLGEAATSGSLHRGLRAVLAHITIFHWNRLGLPGAVQGILANAAGTASLPPR